MKLESDKQFKVTDSAVNSILEKYGFELISYIAASSGIENTTLLIKAKPLDVVIRIYRLNKKPIAEMELEISFMEHLYKNDIKVPRIIKNKIDEKITQLQWNNNTWQVVALEYISGEHAPEYNTELIVDIARWQARMHYASDTYLIPQNAPKIDKTLYESYFLPLIDTSSVENLEINYFLERAKIYALKLDDNLPVGLCHLDYDKDNIISEDNKVKAILDFDDLSVAPYVVCLGYTLWHVWQHGGKVLVDQYINEYESIRPLGTREKKALPFVILFRHYMISDLKILNGHTTSLDANNYIKLEQSILKLCD